MIIANIILSNNYNIRTIIVAQFNPRDLAHPQKPSYDTTYYKNLGKSSCADYENKNGLASLLTEVIEIVVTFQELVVCLSDCFKKNSRHYTERVTTSSKRNKINKK